MSDETNSEKRDRTLHPLIDVAAKQVNRKLKAKTRRKRSAWFGLGMFGLVGWAVAVPTLIGIALGMCLDDQTTTERSWTLALLIAGLCLGCFNAWIWVSRESRDDD